MKYSHTYVKIVEDMKILELWAVWEDVNNWSVWQSDLDYAKLDGQFIAGQNFVFKPKGGPKFKLRLVSVIKNQEFTDCASFPLAKMYATHKFMQVSENQVKIETTFVFKGILAGLWWNIIGKKIAHNEANQTEELLTRVRSLRNL